MKKKNNSRSLTIIEQIAVKNNIFINILIRNYFYYKSVINNSSSQKEAI